MCSFMKIIYVFEMMASVSEYDYETKEYAYDQRDF